jgi:hypothetical protein
VLSRPIYAKQHIYNGEHGHLTDKKRPPGPYTNVPKCHSHNNVLCLAGDAFLALRPPYGRQEVTKKLAMLLATVVLLLALAAGVAQGQTASTGPETVVPYLDTGYKYKVVGRGADSGFEAPSFDDSTSDWKTGDAGFGTLQAGSCSLNNPANNMIQTEWPVNTDILLRKNFDLPNDASNVKVSVAIDNDVQVFVNGQDISGGIRKHDGCPERPQEPSGYIFKAPDSALNKGSSNVLAVRGVDRGGIGYLDIQVTYDSVSPTVDNVSPADAATNVALNTAVEATFSEAIDRRTLSPSTFTLTKQGDTTAVPATLTYDNATNKAKLVPTCELAGNTTYSATIKGESTGVKDWAGNTLEQDYNWTFTTTDEETAWCANKVELDQQQTSSNDHVLVDEWGYYQKVTAGVSGKIKKVSLYIGCCNNGLPPDGGLNITVGDSGYAYIPWWKYQTKHDGSLSWVDVPLDPAPVVEAGEKYYIGVYGDYSALEETAYLWGVTTSDGYPGGDLFSGETGDNAGYDATFKTYVTPSDGTPPETTITTGPSGTVDHSDVVFEFASSESDSSFKCRILRDGEVFFDWHSCTPGNSGPYPDGSYTFEVKAIDASGSIDPTPDSRTWTVATPPTVSSVSPADAATGVGLTTNVEAWFDELDGMDSTTITDQTFTLTKQGSSSPVDARVSYEGSNKATLDPDSDLEENTSYTATIKGGSTGAKDLAGNALVQDYSWTFTTVNAPPTVANYTPTETTSVPRDTPLTATFSTKMDASTITPATIKFQVYNKKKKKWVGVDHAVEYKADTRTATVKPGSGLAASKRYRVTITTNVKSSAGVALDQNAKTSGNQPETWTFITAST